MVLEGYSDAIISEVTDPRTGIQRRSKFPPTIAEVVEACTEEVARAERIKKFSALRPELREPRPKCHRANVFVPPSAPQYAVMIERAKTADPQEWRMDAERKGIWVALGWLTDEVATKSGGWRQLTGAELRVKYGQPAERATTEAAE